MIFLLNHINQNEDYKALMGCVVLLLIVLVYKFINNLKG